MITSWRTGALQSSANMLHVCTCAMPMLAILQAGLELGRTQWLIILVAGFAGQAELQGTSSGAAETGHISPPQTPPAGSVPNASGTPVGSNPTTSSDDMHDKSAGSSKRKRFRTKDEKNVALNKLSQLRYRQDAADLKLDKCGMLPAGSLAKRQLPHLAVAHG